MDERIPSCADAVAAFLRDRSLEGAPAHSISTYRGSLKLLSTPEPVSTLHQTMRDQLHARCQQVSPNTAIGIISTHRAFARYCLARGWLLSDPLAGLRSPRKREPPPRFLAPDECRRLALAATDLLDQAILVLLGKGLRAGEACAVRPADIRHDGDGWYLAVRSEKGGTHRELPLDDPEAALLLSVPVRGTLLGIGRKQLWTRIRRLGKASGVAVHPHLLRHSFALAYLERTGDQGVLQTLLGHRSADMTRYYARAALERVALRRAREAGVRLFGNAP